MFDAVELPRLARWDFTPWRGLAKRLVHSPMASDRDVSVIIATCRRERFVVEAIESALCEQSLTLEVIVVDDSGDKSAKEVVEGIADTRVRYIARDENSGRRPGRVRNVGAHAARGALLHFLDDDDRLADGALRTLAAALASHPNAGMAFGRVAPFGDDPATVAREQDYFAGAADIAAGLRSSRLRFATQLLFGDTCLVNSACMLRRSVFDQIGGYDTELTVIEDVEMFLRAGRAAGFVFVDRPILHYRKGHASLSRDRANTHAVVVDAYRRMHRTYREVYGAPEFYALKVLARAHQKIAALHRRLFGGAGAAL